MGKGMADDTEKLHAILVREKKGPKALAKVIIKNYQVSFERYRLVDLFMECLSTFDPPNDIGFCYFVITTLTV